MSEIEGSSKRGVNCKDRVNDCMHERGADREGRLGQARRECLDRERWKLFCCGLRMFPDGTKHQRL